MSKLALDPQLSRILLEPSLTAINEMLVISSFLSVRDVRMRPLDKQQKADQCHQNYSDKSSDILSVLKLWDFLEQKKRELSSSKFKQWCQKHFINFVGWLEWRNVYHQTKDSLSEFNLKVNQNKAEDDEIHRSLICGFVSHLLHKTPERYYQGARGIKVWIHPSSVAFKNKSEWLLATELVETDKVYARGNLPIQSSWIEPSVPHLIKNNYQDIHWRKNKGHAACFLSQTVLGLPITTNRLVESSDIEPMASRELFLLEGLARENINQTFPFINSNRELNAQVKSEEERLRKFDIRISDEQLSELYGKAIPETISSTSALRKWLKRDWKKRNNRLVFTREQLTQRLVESIEEYPSEIYIKGVYLPVSYSFSPGKIEDGMTVDIPPQMVVQFNQNDFDWLVPGYLSEKIQAVIKCLPKPIRKKLIPIADSAHACSEAILKTKYQDRNFKTVLIETLEKLNDLKLTPDQIDLENIPEHLKMKFKNSSINNKNKLVLAEISKLKEQGKDSTPKSGGKDSLSKDHGPLYSWPISFEGVEQNIEKKGRTVRIFVGLMDKGSYVQIAQFADLASATKSHMNGVARLLVLEQIKTIKEINNGWPERKEIERLNLRFGGFSELLDWISFSEALSIVKNCDSLITDSDSFIEISKSFAKRAREKISSSLVESLKLLREMNKIYLKLSYLKSEVYKDSVNDIKEQIKSLWESKRFAQQSEDLFSNYSRYFLAIESRITRIQENFPKEQQSLDTWLDWQAWWSELIVLKIDAATEELLEQLFWMLQEYRVSLFAIKIKVVGGVSAKKLQKLFDEIELGIKY